MAEVLVLADVSAEGTVGKATFELLTAARVLGEPSAVVIGAPGTAEKVKAGSPTTAPRRSTSPSPTSSTPTSSAPRPTRWPPSSRRPRPAAVLLASTAEGKEIAARLAIKIDSGILTDAVGIDADGTVTQSIFGGAHHHAVARSAAAPRSSRARQLGRGRGLGRARRGGGGRGSR